MMTKIQERKAIIIELLRVILPKWTKKNEDLIKVILYILLMLLFSFWQYKESGQLDWFEILRFLI